MNHSFLFFFILILLPFSHLSAKDDISVILPPTKPVLGKANSQTVQTKEERIINVLSDLFYFSKKILENAFQCRTLSPESCQVITNNSNIEHLLSQMNADQKKKLLAEIQDFLKKHEDLISNTHSTLQGYSDHLKSQNNPLQTWDHPFKQAAERIIGTLRGFFPAQKGKEASHQIHRDDSDQRHEVLDRMAQIAKALFQEALKNQNHQRDLETLHQNIELCFDLIKSITSSLDDSLPMKPLHLIPPFAAHSLEYLE